jgi:integrase
MFGLARTWELIKGDNPAVGIKLFAEEKRERYLSPDELQKVNAALLAEADWRWHAYFPLLLLLGARKSELLTARWPDIDFGAGTWRIPQTKSGKPHLLPLPAAAIAILEALPSRNTSDWVFPGDGASGHIVEPSKAWQRIRKRARVVDVRVHDLRHTLGAWLTAQGINLPLIGRALNHSQAQTTARYAHASIADVRAALEQNAQAMTGTGPGSVKAKPEA